MSHYYSVAFQIISSANIISVTLLNIYLDWLLVTLTAHSQNHYSPVKLPEGLLLRSWIFYTSVIERTCKGTVINIV